MLAVIPVEQLFIVVSLTDTFFSGALIAVLPDKVEFVTLLTLSIAILPPFIVALFTLSTSFIPTFDALMFNGPLIFLTVPESSPLKL